jgi:hypothetical protein
LKAWVGAWNRRNRSFPTHCHLDGGLFLFRRASPRETSPKANLDKGRLKDTGQVKVNPFHRLLPKRDSQEEKSTEECTCLRDKTNTTRVCACSGLVLHQMTIFKCIYMSKMT